MKNPDFSAQKQEALAGWDIRTIDAPIGELIDGFMALPFCFTLQSCYGHFLYKGQDDPCSTGPIQMSPNMGKVDYKIAYMALCIDPVSAGRRLYGLLEDLPLIIDYENVQFGSAEWFWEKQLNSYVLQVEPYRYRYKDRVLIEPKEALHLEKVRGLFFEQLEEVLKMVEQD